MEKNSSPLKGDAVLVQPELIFQPNQFFTMMRLSDEERKRNLKNDIAFQKAKIAFAKANLRTAKDHLNLLKGELKKLK